jgi:catechol 2,3-dioxygenase-like lactoylglutathione lyase family enzyme
MAMGELPRPDSGDPWGKVGGAPRPGKGITAGHEASGWCDSPTLPPTTLDPTTMVKTRGLTHLALRVHDAERAFRFYHDVFGMVAIYRGDGFVQAQTPGTWDVLVLEEGERAAVGKSGISHFGFRLLEPADIRGAAEAVRAAGGTITSQGEFVPGEPYLFCTDLDGNEVEIWYELPTPADPA